MKIAITSRSLKTADGHDWELVEWDPEAEELFRQGLRTIAYCDYFVVDVRNFYAGVYVGFCLQNNIPVIAIVDRSVFGIHGEYARLTLDEWRQFSGSLEGTIEELQVTEELQDQGKDQRAVGELPGTYFS